MRMSFSMIWFLTGLAAGAVAVAAVEPPTPPVPVPSEARRVELDGTDPADGIPPLLRAPEAAGVAPGFGAGLRAYVDPVTGELVARPTRAQVRELTRALAEHRFEQGMDYGADWDTEGLYRFVLPEGGTGVHLGGRFLTSTVVRVGTDGELHFECTHDPDESPAHRSDSPLTASGTRTSGVALK